MAKKKIENPKVKILKSVAGRFGLSHNIGDVISFEEKQASEIVESGFGEYVK